MRSELSEMQDKLAITDASYRGAQMEVRELQRSMGDARQQANTLKEKADEARVLRTRVEQLSDLNAQLEHRLANSRSLAASAAGSAITEDTSSSIPTEDTLKMSPASPDRYVGSPSHTVGLTKDNVGTPNRSPGKNENMSSGPPNHSMIGDAERLELVLVKMRGLEKDIEEGMKNVLALTEGLRDGDDALLNMAYQVRKLVEDISATLTQAVKPDPDSLEHTSIARHLNQLMAQVRFLFV